MSFYFTHPNWLWCAIPIVLTLAVARKRSLVEFSRARRRAILTTRAVVCAASAASKAADFLLAFLPPAIDSVVEGNEEAA